GLLAALQWAIDHGEHDVQIRSDSELLVKQMRGEYKVKHPGLQSLVARARLLMLELGSVTLEHVRREHNKEADRLSNVAVDISEKMYCPAAAGPTAERRHFTCARIRPIIRPAFGPSTRYECNASECVFVHN